MDAGLLPVKRLDRAKARLAAQLGDAARREVAAALLDDALTLCSSVGFLRWWVVSDDPAVLRRAADRGLDTLRDGGRGLNAALAAGAVAAARAGAASVTIVPADVPLARADDLADVVDTGATSDVVVVPARSGGGTNALHLAPPGVMDPEFGPESLRAHVTRADRLGVRCSVLPSARLGLDVDTIDDVDALLAHPGAGDTHAGRVLARLRSPTA
ncbi:MAG TPA: 2-phospho-L-lactate guanylyltransferase [Actinomycetota bacterium]|nr:2-phospho-L-lactate guanylyltransferase [Actinomycetota bacterium]